MGYQDRLKDGSLSKVVQVFRNGRSRAIRIPKEFEFEADQVKLTKNADGNLTISPVAPKKSWADVIAFIKEEGPMDFPDIEDYPPRPVDLELKDET